MHPSNNPQQSDARYLTCERFPLFEILIFAFGMLGAYTYNLRGGVFCNAQSANVMLMALKLGTGEWMQGLYYCIPITAYLIGIVVSTALPTKVRRFHLLRWDTYLLGFEIVVIFLLGFVPLDIPYQQVIQVIVNFLAAMQYNTYRQAEGISMATTFVTNHFRQFGSELVQFLQHHNSAAGKRCLRHLSMVGCFFAGGLVLTALCGVLQEKVVWLTLAPLLVCFCVLAHADLKLERKLLGQTPHGH